MKSNQKDSIMIFKVHHKEYNQTGWIKTLFEKKSQEQVRSTVDRNYQGLKTMRDKIMELLQLLTSRFNTLNIQFSWGKIQIL